MSKQFMMKHAKGSTIAAYTHSSQSDAGYTLGTPDDLSSPKPKTFFSITYRFMNFMSGSHSRN